MILNRSFSGPLFNSGFALVSDLLPDFIADQAKNDAPIAFLIEFDPIQVTGISEAVLCSATNGSFRISSDGVNYDAYSSLERNVNEGDYVQYRFRSPHSWNTTATETLSIGQLDVTFSVTTIAQPGQSLTRFVPSLMSVDIHELTLFGVRDNIATVTVSYEGAPLDLTQFDTLELRGFRNQTFSSDSVPTVLSGDANGLVVLDIGSELSVNESVDTSLIGFSAYYPYGVVLWHPNLTQAHVTINIVDA